MSIVTVNRERRLIGKQIIEVLLYNMISTTGTDVTDNDTYVDDDTFNAPTTIQPSCVFIADGKPRLLIMSYG